MATITQDFPTAPMGRRVIYTLVFSVLLTFGATTFAVVGIVLNPNPHGKAAASYAAFLVPLATVFAMFVSFGLERARSTRVRIEENVLVVRKKRYPLEGLREAVRDPDVLKGARRCWGNSGLGVIRGKFKSKRIGKFDAFLTDTEHAVVLRWPEQTLAVSPDDPEFFILSARSAAGLSMTPGRLAP
jgi:hypothetical protein